MRTGYIIASGGILAAVTAAFLGYRKSSATKKSVQDAIAGPSSDVKDKIAAATTPAAVKAAVDLAAPPAPQDVQDAAAKGDVETVKDSSWYKGTFQARLTGYHPLDVSTEAQKKMEGKPVDRRGRELHFLEDALAGKVPDVSVSGDPLIFPYGQAIKLDAWPTLTFRVVDTGSHFTGVKKTYRIMGREPLDIATRSKDTHPPELATATIIKGDTYDKARKEVVVSKFKGQQVEVGGLHMLGAV